MFSFVSKYLKIIITKIGFVVLKEFSNSHFFKRVFDFLSATFIYLKYHANALFS